MERRVVFNLNLRAFVNSKELWLSEMALNGWRLSDMTFFQCTFEKHIPGNYQYLIYEGFNSAEEISFDYYAAKRKYRSKSKINKKSRGVFEIDGAKIDKEFVNYVRLRNKKYLHTYLLLALFFLFGIAVSLICLLHGEYNVLFSAAILAFTGLSFLYCLISAILISRQSSKRETYAEKTGESPCLRE